MANQNHFDLNLDTVKPSGSISRSSQYIKANTTVSISSSGAPAYMRVWFDEEATGVKSVYSSLTDAQKTRLNTISSGSSSTTSSVKYVCYSEAPWIAVNSSYATKFAINGRFYYHVVFMDSVGNESIVYNTAQINYDITSPVASLVKIVDRTSTNEVYTNEAAVTLSFSFDDTGSTASGVVRAKVVGDCVPNPLYIENLTGSSYTGPITLTTGDGSKKVKVSVIDRAGNESSSIDSNTIMLDTVGASATVILEKNTYIDSTGSHTQADSAHVSLPSWINNSATKPASADIVYPDFKLDIKIGSTEGAVHDVVGYKYWCQYMTTNTSEPSSYTTISSSSSTPNNPIVIKGLKFSSSNQSGIKVNVKLIDKAGNETTFQSNAIGIDNSVPAITTFKVSPLIIPANATATITYAGSSSISGVKEYKLTKVTSSSPTTIYSGSSLPDSKTWTVPNQETLVEGSNTYQLEIVDNATNHSSTTLTLKFDSTAPTNVSIGSLPGQLNSLGWYRNSEAVIVPVTYTDGLSGGKYIYTWVDTTSNSTTIPTGATSIKFTTTSTANVAKTESISSGNIYFGSGMAQTTSSVKNYVHVVVEDAVGNKSSAIHKEIKFDSTLPTCSITSPTANQPFNKVSINLATTASDSTGSGVYQYMLWGQVTQADSSEATGWKAYPSGGAVSVTLTGLADNTKDELRTIYFKVRDYAGNVSETKSVVVELDLNAPTGELSLRQPSAANKNLSLPAVVSYRTFKVFLKYTGDGTNPIGAVQYKVYGDYNTTESATGVITESNAQWQNLPSNPESGWYIPGENDSNVFYWSATNGAKVFNLVLKDNAGNISRYSATTTYDSTPPEVVCGNPDYNIISCEHVLRRTIESGTTTSSTITNKFCDEIVFTFTPNERIRQWKVCAYKTEALASAGSYADAAIGTTYGSSMMTCSEDAYAVGPSEVTKSVTCVIKGKDFIKALGTDPDTYLATADGSKLLEGFHYIVVYVKDLGNTWSGKAIF